MRNQQKDKEQINIAQNNKYYSIQNFQGADKKYSLICRNRKIVIPKQLKKQVVEWYHNALCHPGETYKAKYFSLFLLEKFTKDST